MRRGQPLFAVDGQPVTLLYGSLPAWRPFAPGMTAGPDVRQLQRNLAALGFDPGPADGVFGWSTQLAVRAVAAGQRHDRHRDDPARRGRVPAGAAARHHDAADQLGAPVTPGASVVSGTSLTPGVQVSLPVGGPAVRRGDQVTVTMPDGTTTVPGTVTAVGTCRHRARRVRRRRQRHSRAARAAIARAAARAAIPAAASLPPSPSRSPSGPPIPAGLDQAPVQVSITQQRADGVLAVPVTALLARTGGGYAVQAAGPHGRVIPVTTGLFDDTTGLVAVTGAGLTAGLAVAVAQG